MHVTITLAKKIELQIPQYHAKAVPRHHLRLVLVWPSAGGPCPTWPASPRSASPFQGHQVHRQPSSAPPLRLPCWMVSPLLIEPIKEKIGLQYRYLIFLNITATSLLTKWVIFRIWKCTFLSSFMIREDKTLLFLSRDGEGVSKPWVGVLLGEVALEGVPLRESAMEGVLQGEVALEWVLLATTWPLLIPLPASDSTGRMSPASTLPWDTG